MKSITILAILGAIFIHQNHARTIEEDEREKKDGVDFMGMRVSYPQYLRLVAIQREVIRMDQTIRHMLTKYNPVELAQNPHWMELLELYDSLKKMLPPDYLEQLEDSDSV